MAFIVFLVAIAAGVANPFQSGANAELNAKLGSMAWAAAAVYASGLAGVLLIEVVLRQPLPLARAASAPAWAWLGGLISILPTLAGLTLAQRLGAGVFTGVTITAGLAMSIVVDHFGLAGFHQHSASPMRAAGCGLMVAGLWIVART